MRPITPLVASDFHGRVQNMIQRFEVNIDGAWVDLTGYESVEPVPPDVVNTDLVVHDMTHAHTANNVILFYNTAGVVYAASCEYADVVDAIDAANPGDTVMVPAGSATWLAQLLISKGILLIGAGIGSTNITAGWSSPTSLTLNSANYLIRYAPTNVAANEPFRLSGFTVDLDSRCMGVLLRNTGTTALTKNRVDHLQIENPYQRSLVLWGGPIYGCADNIRFIGSGTSGLSQVIGMGATAWNNLSFDFGTADNFYLEDCYYYWGTKGLVISAGDGGRYCVRYCTMDNFGGSGEFFDAHGNMGTGGNHSTMGAEIYGNTINVDGRYGYLTAIRGGKTLCYNNTLVHNTSNWNAGRIREEYHDSLNAPAEGLIDGQPQHVSDTYFWNNTFNGSVLAPIIYETIDYANPGVTGYDVGLADHGVVPRFDYWCFKQQAAFDGSTGMGVGLRSARPLREDMSGAPAGVAWWATDESKLYRWTGSAWVLHYEPYTYPHPLRGDPVLGD